MCQGNFKCILEESELDVAKCIYPNVNPFIYAPSTVHQTQGRP